MRFASSLRRSSQRRSDDERGATLIIVGVCSVLFIWAGAFAVDLGIQTVGNRQLQTVADAGALDAARYIYVSGANLQTEAQRGATDNGSTANIAAALGYWTGTQFQPQAGHCSLTTPSAYPPCNAVSVTAGEPVPELFHGGSAPLSRSAIGAINGPPCPGGSGGGGGGGGGGSWTGGGIATFSIGTYLASFNTQQSAVLNVLLGALGTSANVTAVGYAGLASSNVTLLQLINASAGVLTPTNILTTSLTAKQWVVLFATVTGNPYLSSSFLGGTVSAATSASLSQMASIDGSTCSSGSLSSSALATSINVLQTLTTEAEVANGNNVLDVTAALSLPNVSSAALALSLIQIPQVGYGAVGTTVSTSQINADLQLTLGLGLGVLDVPVNAALGTATLKTVTCVNNAMTSTKINASTTAASGTVTVLGSTLASLAVSGAGPSLLGYGAAVVPPTASTASADTNPITIGTTTPTISFNNVNNGLLNLSQQAVVDPLLTTLSSALGPVLQAAGVNVAGAEVTDLHTQCADVTLVN